MNNKMDILSGLLGRNCGHIINEILDQMGIVDLSSVWHVSMAWNCIVEEYVQSKMSTDSQHCFKLYNALLDKKMEMDFRRIVHNQITFASGDTKSLLKCAAQEGHLDVLKDLYKNWTSKDKTSGLPSDEDEERAPLEMYDFYSVELYKVKGVNTVEIKDVSPVIYAAKYARINVLEWFLETFSTDEVFFSQMRSSITETALKHGHVDMLEFLLSQQNYKEHPNQHFSRI